MVENKKRFRAAIERIDAVNSGDPNRVIFEGKQYPKELLYSQRMSESLGGFAPNAPEAVQLAVRAQHIQRWEIPRSEYPKDRQGYRKWRTDLGRFHAKKTAVILRDVGYPPRTVTHVQSLLQKKQLKIDSDCQLLEDVICLVFLRHYFADFTKEHDEAKLVKILGRTWKKMSLRGQSAALEIEMPKHLRALIGKALEEKNAQL